MDGGTAGTRLLIVSGHRIFRECLATMLRGTSAQSCDFADDRDQAIEILSAGDRDVVLLDHNGHSEEEVVRLTAELREVSAGVRLLVIGDAQAERNLAHYIEAGAAGFVTNGRSMQDLMDAILSVVQFEAECSPEQAAIVFARLQQLARDRGSDPPLDTCDLTQREFEILQCIDLGQSNKEIAGRLHLSVHTVKTHVHHILEKVGAANRRQAVYMAYRKGWLSNSKPTA